MIRRILTVVLALTAGTVLGLASVPALAAFGFNDVSPANSHGSNIEGIAERGVTQGCNDGADYCPENFVRRDQMASFLERNAEFVTAVTSHKPAASVITIVPGEKGTAVASCPAGKIAVDGGYEIEGANASADWLMERAQIGDPALPQQGYDGANFPAWHVVIRNTGEDAFTVQPEVVCAPAPVEAE